MSETKNSSPRVFVSYSHDSEDHRENIADFVQTLRHNGLDAQFDQFVENSPPLSWPKWMSDEIVKADFVLVVFTETYARRFEGKEKIGRGLGARWEGSIITSEMYCDKTNKVKFIPIVIVDTDIRHVSGPMSLTNFYVIGEASNRNISNIDKLLRHLHGKPALIPRPLGSAPLFDDENIEKEDEILGLSVAARFAIDDALELATAGEEKIAESKLSPLLDSSSAIDAAAAAFYTGVIRLQSEQFAGSITAFRRALEINASHVINHLASASLENALSILNAHYGEGSAVAAAHKYLELVISGDMAELWLETDYTLRLVLAQAWVQANANHPALKGLDIHQLATELASPVANSKLRNDFFATQLSELQDAFQSYDSTSWGAAERPRRFGIDYELVILMETGGDFLIFEDDMTPKTIQLLMRRRAAAWHVASFQPHYPVPGWPPSCRPLLEKSDPA